MEIWIPKVQNIHGTSHKRVKKPDTCSKPRGLIPPLYIQCNKPLFSLKANSAVSTFIFKQKHSLLSTLLLLFFDRGRYGISQHELQGRCSQRPGSGEDEPDDGHSEGDGSSSERHDIPDRRGSPGKGSPSSQSNPRHGSSSNPISQGDDNPNRAGNQGQDLGHGGCHQEEEPGDQSDGS